jgi:hypothetical protein
MRGVTVPMTWGESGIVNVASSDSGSRGAELLMIMFNEESDVLRWMKMGELGTRDWAVECAFARVFPVGVRFGLVCSL